MVWPRTLISRVGISLRVYVRLMIMHWLTDAISDDGESPGLYTCSLASSLSSNTNLLVDPGQATYPPTSMPQALAASHMQWKNQTRNSPRFFQLQHKLYWAKVIQFSSDLSEGNVCSVKYKVHSTGRPQGFCIYTVSRWFMPQVPFNQPSSLRAVYTAIKTFLWPLCRNQTFEEGVSNERDWLASPELGASPFAFLSLQRSSLSWAHCFCHLAFFLLVTSG